MDRKELITHIREEDCLDAVFEALVEDPEANKDMRYVLANLFKAGVAAHGRDFFNWIQWASDEARKATQDQGKYRVVVSSIKDGLTTTELIHIVKIIRKAGNLSLKDAKHHYDLMKHDSNLDYINEKPMSKETLDSVLPVFRAFFNNVSFYKL